MKIQLTSNYLRNLIRTVVPGGIGAVIAYLLQKYAPSVLPWYHAHVTAGYTSSLVLLASSVWYAIFRKLENKFKWASAFLGAKPVPAAVPAVAA